MGSAKFKKLVDACKWDEAMELCMAQCEKKADILVFDSDLIDGQSAMSKFMRLCVIEPTVAWLPFTIDSWPVVEKGLKFPPEGFFYHAIPKGLNMSIVNPGGRIGGVALHCLPSSGRAAR